MLYTIYYLQYTTYYTPYTIYHILYTVYHILCTTFYILYATFLEHLHVPQVGLRGPGHHPAGPPEGAEEPQDKGDTRHHPRGSMYSYINYFGLKVPPIWVLWGPSIWCMGTWTDIMSCRILLFYIGALIIRIRFWGFLY